MKKRSLLSLLLITVMCIGLAKREALAEEIQSNEAQWYGIDIDLGNLNLTNYETIIAYSGYEWWVVGGGDADTDVGLNPGGSGTVTVFLRNRTLSEIGTMLPFREGYEILPMDKSPEDYKEYTGTHKNSSGSVSKTAYYAKNPAQMADWNKPNEYAGSTVHQALEAAADLFSDKERNYIIPRDFEGSDNNIASNDGIVGPAVTDQYLWILSENEWKELKDAGNKIATIMQTYGNKWWLRTPGHSQDCQNECGFHMTLVTRTSLEAMHLVYEEYADVRPALTLRIPSQTELLMLTETYDPSALTVREAGKTLAKAGQGFIELERPNTTSSDSRLKFTLLDKTQRLQISADSAGLEDGRNLEFSYVFTHEEQNEFLQHDYYVSCMVRNEDDKLLGYAKLADASARSQDRIAMNLDSVIEKLSLSDGEYKFLFFSEEANGALYTDFASSPVTMTVNVNGGSGSVINFNGHIHNLDTQQWRHDGNEHWHGCRDVNCPTPDEKHDQAPHSNSRIESVDATCTEAGVAGGTYCVVCHYGKEAAEQTIAALGHDMRPYENEIQATCTTDGKTAVMKCSRCGHTEGGKQIPATGHSYVDGICTVCGAADFGVQTSVAAGAGSEMLTLQDHTEGGKQIPAAGHSYVDGICTACGAVDSGFQVSIIAGGDSIWYKGSKTGLSFTSSAAFAHFQKVQVDEKDLDETNYEVKAGSTVVTLKASYLESLPIGKHRIGIVSDTGMGETSFTVAERTGESNSQGGSSNGVGQNQSNTNAPHTGDDKSPALWIALVFLVLVGMGGAGYYRWKKSHRAKEEDTD